MFRLNPFEFRAGLRGCRCAYRASLTGLNPFEFRAGLRARRRFPAEAACDVLIPLNSGQAYEPAGREGGCREEVLIPLNSGQAYECLAYHLCRVFVCLNPFEFRAGLRVSLTDGREIYGVLIPLNSGQAYEVRAEQRMRDMEVLIPLNSGQAYELMAEVVRLQARGLNPFEFRAGLRGSRQTKSQQQQRQVLIPLNSGQAYEGGPCRA